MTPLSMFAMRCNSVQEQEWLEKQAEARKATQGAKQRDPSAIDSDPMWLCDRGKEFFKQENYQSAINAFTEAVTMDPTCAPAYSNRGACHLKMGYPLGCAADCLKAISLLQPACDANAKSRLLAYGRRAAPPVRPPPHPLPSSPPLLLLPDLLPDGTLPEVPSCRSDSFSLPSSHPSG